MAKPTTAVPELQKCNVATQGEAKKFEERALEVLKEEGFRITMPRVQVIRALAESNRALSAYAIHERIVSKGGRIDVVSVYRILSTLQAVCLVHHIGVVDGYYPCRADAEHIHDTEHLVCEQCGCVAELPIAQSSAKAVESQAAQAGFRPSEMKIEVLGTCAHCLGK
ncbi:MAG: transcriptional repressor [Fimbriimonadaceae bacterium]|nr:transcriptional repressor [Fimbriimonadaceae bacterium]